jgi:hypothetical protein
VCRFGTGKHRQAISIIGRFFVLDREKPASLVRTRQVIAIFCQQSAVGKMHDACMVLYVGLKP